MGQELPFDRVAVDQKSLTVGEFLALPMAVRIDAILTKRVAFFLGETPVELSFALKNLRALYAKPPSRGDPTGGDKP